MYSKAMFLAEQERKLQRSPDEEERWWAASCQVTMRRVRGNLHVTTTSYTTNSGMEAGSDNNKSPVFCLEVVRIDMF